MDSRGEATRADDPGWRAIVLVSRIIGFLAGLVTFFGAWIYCTAEYGFLFGFGFGWMPAMILAYIVGLAIMFLWLPALLIIGLLWLKHS